MGWLFGEDKDKTQNQRLQQLEKNQQKIIKNQGILIKNNDYFINTIKALQGKDRVHDKKDAEIEALIAGLKSMTQSVEQAEKQAEKVG